MGPTGKQEFVNVNMFLPKCNFFNKHEYTGEKAYSLFLVKAVYSYQINVK